jgi:hypothetical protein
MFIFVLIAFHVLPNCYLMVYCGDHVISVNDPRLGDFEEDGWHGRLDGKRGMFSKIGRSTCL